MKEKDQIQNNDKNLTHAEIAKTFIPPEGWAICSGSCGQPVRDVNQHDYQCSSGSCTGKGCECRLFRGKSNYPENGYTWEHVADQGDWGNVGEEYWPLCVCTKRA